MHSRFLILIAALAMAACSKGSSPRDEMTQSSNSAPTPDTGIKGVHRDHKGEPVPDVKILDVMSVGRGSLTSLRNFQHGQPMLLNLWASWCAPCVKELPTLQTLQKQRGGTLRVMPVSQDSGPQRSVEAFLDQHHLDFAAFQDPKMTLSGALGPDTVLPTTILFDANGKEVWRFVGDLDWTSPEAAKLLAEAGASPKSD